MSASQWFIDEKLRAIEARERALRHVARLAVVSGPQRVVIERDASLAKHDRRWLAEELGRHPHIEYDLLGKHDDPMLWIADAVAWVTQKGGKWKSILEPLIVAEIRV